MNTMSIHIPLKQRLNEKTKNETLLLNEFLNVLASTNFSLGYRVIEAPGDELGLEIFNADRKIAEIYCVERKGGDLTGELQVHGEKNWELSKILPVQEACSYVAE